MQLWRLSIPAPVSDRHQLPDVGLWHETLRDLVRPSRTQLTIAF